MRILTGRHAGRTAIPRDFANDWIGADIDGIDQGVVLKPNQVQLDDGDRELFDRTPAQHVGSFWSNWRLEPDGTFTSLREWPPAARPRNGAGGRRSGRLTGTRRR